MGKEQHNIDIPRDEIADFCYRHHIRRLSFFGSALRDDFGSNRDIDVLVEFEEGKTPSFLSCLTWRMSFQHGWGEEGLT
jgi:predicted nucleotidyltransferase